MAMSLALCATNARNLWAVIVMTYYWDTEGSGVTTMQEVSGVTLVITAYKFGVVHSQIKSIQLT